MLCIPSMLCIRKRAAIHRKPAFRGFPNSPAKRKKTQMTRKTIVPRPRGQNGPQETMVNDGKSNPRLNAPGSRTLLLSTTVRIIPISVVSRIIVIWNNWTSNSTQSDSIGYRIINHWRIDRTNSHGSTAPWGYTRTRALHTRACSLSLLTVSTCLGTGDIHHRKSKK